MQAYRIHGKNGVQFEDTEPQENCTYDIVDLKLPEGSNIIYVGGARDTLRRVKLKGNSYTHLETLDDKPILRVEAQREYLTAGTNDFVELKFTVVEENLQWTFDTICSYDAPDNIYHVNYVNGRYQLTDLYSSQIISKQEAMKYKAKWG